MGGIIGCAIAGMIVGGLIVYGVGRLASMEAPLAVILAGAVVGAFIGVFFCFKGKQ